MGHDPESMDIGRINYPTAGNACVSVDTFEANFEPGFEDVFNFIKKKQMADVFSTVFLDFGIDRVRTLPSSG